MKYYFLAGLIVLAGLVAVVLSRSRTVALDEHYTKKRDVAETETKVRPASFEDMKWKAAEGAVIRTPATDAEATKK